MPSNVDHKQTCDTQDLGDIIPWWYKQIHGIEFPRCNDVFKTPCKPKVLFIPFDWQTLEGWLLSGDLSKICGFPGTCHDCSPATLSKMDARGKAQQGGHSTSTKVVQTSHSIEIHWSILGPQRRNKSNELLTAVLLDTDGLYWEAEAQEQAPLKWKEIKVDNKSVSDSISTVKMAISSVQTCTHQTTMQTQAKETTTT